jgi:hypothetical protein
VRIRDRDLAILEIGPSEARSDLRSRLALAELSRLGPPIFGDPQGRFGPDDLSYPHNGLTDVLLLDDQLVAACAWESPEGGEGELVRSRRSGSLMRRVATTWLPFPPAQLAMVGASVLVLGRHHGLVPYSLATEGAGGAGGDEIVDGARRGEGGEGREDGEQGGVATGARRAGGEGGARHAEGVMVAGRRLGVPGVAAVHLAVGEGVLWVCDDAHDLYVAPAGAWEEGARRVSLGGPVHGFVAWGDRVAVLWGGFGAVERLEILAWDEATGTVTRCAEVPVSDAGGWRDMCIEGNKVIFARTSALTGYDVSDPDRLRRGGEVELFPRRGPHSQDERAPCVAALGEYHVALLRGDRLSIVDTRWRSQWSVVAETEMPGRMTHLLPISDGLTAAAGPDGICLLGFQLRISPQIRMLVDERRDRGAIAADDGTLYVVERDRGVRILDKWSQKHPVEERYLPLPGALRRVADCAVAHGWMYLAVGNAGVVKVPTLARAEAMDDPTRFRRWASRVLDGLEVAGG